MAGLPGLPGTKFVRFQLVQAVRKAGKTHPAQDVESARSLPEGSAKVRQSSHPDLFLLNSTSPGLPFASLV